MYAAREERYRLIYNTPRWKRLRLQHIGSDPLNALCQCCLHGHSICCSGLTNNRITKLVNDGVLITGTTYTPMNVVDHKLSVVNGGAVWSLDNLQSLCNECHGRKHRVDMLDAKMQVINKNMDALDDWS